ncbi:hypothetical protein PGQ11_003600 [Apiospora arundinis]|uniref:Uncharacterized protein n=1 Tax=Apiospora arundinis TaxID=335852 RepID=A0ABR2J6B7_9PEZI
MLLLHPQRENPPVACVLLSTDVDKEPGSLLCLCYYSFCALQGGAGIHRLVHLLEQSQEQPHSPAQPLLLKPLYSTSRSHMPSQHV